MTRSCALALLLCLAPASARAEIAESLAGWSADTFVWATSPVGFTTGMVLGGGLVVGRGVGPKGLLVGARLAAGSTSEATSEWKLEHVHVLVAANAGWGLEVGAARLFARLDVGALLLRQLGTRQQAERLKAAGIEHERHAWSAGPWVGLDLGVSVTLREPWTLSLSVGPAFTAQRVAGETVARFVGQSTVGVGCAF